jgi:hypothetical protein
MLLGAGSTDYLIDLWINTATNHPDGVLTGMSAVDVALEAGWEDDPERFVIAMMESGFLDRDEDGVYRLHDWEDHQPFVIEAPKRSLQAQKAAEARWGKKTAKPTSPTSHAHGMPAACDGHANRNAPTYLPTKEEIKKPPYPPEGGEPAAVVLPPSPEDNPDNLPGAEISSLNDCAIEFQDLAAAYQQAGGYLDVSPAYKVYESMRYRFPLAQILGDLERRSQSEAWKRMDVPMNLSTYLGKRKWLDPIPQPRERTRASPQPRTFRDKRQMESEQAAKRLKAEMGISNAGYHTAASQVGDGFVQYAALPGGAEKP